MLSIDYFIYFFGISCAFDITSLRKTDNSRGDNLISRLLRNVSVLDAPCRLTDDDEKRFRGVIVPYSAIRFVEKLMYFLICLVYCQEKSKIHDRKTYI